MKEEYKKSIQKIKEIKKRMTIIEYNKLAKKYNLLSAESLKFISGMNFTELIQSVLKEV